MLKFTCRLLIQKDILLNNEIMVLWFRILVVIRLNTRILTADQRCERHLIIKTYITSHCLYFSAAQSYNRLPSLFNSLHCEYFIARKKKKKKIQKYLAFFIKKMIFRSIFFL